MAALITPTNGAGKVPIATTLSWMPVSDAASYDIYFGTTEWLAITGTADTVYSPGMLSYGTTYRWRIDSKNQAGITTGRYGVLAPKTPSRPRPMHF